VVTIPGQPPATVVTGGGFGQLVSLSVQGTRALNGSAEHVNALLFTPQGEQVVSSTDIPGVLTSLGTSFDNTWSGYVMMGNDNFAWTDRGIEVYYVKKPVGWTGRQGLITYEWDVDEEDTTAATTAITFYDSNAAETTANISLSSGGSYTDAAIKIKSASDLCIGNREFDGQDPLALCFNETDAGDFKEIKPNENLGQIDSIPGFLRGINIVECWVVDTDALCDGETFETDLYYELNSGESVSAAGTDASYIMILDKSWFENDDLEPEAGYGDESGKVSDTDIGIDSRGMAIPVYLTGI
jgi:hypothetical protein